VQIVFGDDEAVFGLMVDNCGKNEDIGRGVWYWRIRRIHVKLEASNDIVSIY